MATLYKKFSFSLKTRILLQLNVKNIENKRFLFEKKTTTLNDKNLKN